MKTCARGASGLGTVSNNFAIIRDIQPIPFNKEKVIQLISIIMLPVFHLAHTLTPLEELIIKLIGVVF